MIRNYGMSGMSNRDCGCRQENAYQNRQGSCPQENNCAGEMDFALAMAYVPWQHYKETYDPDKALEVGTIFPELDKPFLGRGRSMYR